MKGVNVRRYLERHQAHARIVQALAAQGVTPANAPTGRPGEEAEDALAGHLDAAGLPYDREVRFAPPRKWRLDFLVGERVAVEIDGGVHRLAGRFAGDMEKHNAITAAGLLLIRCAPEQARTGSIVPTIRAALAQEVQP